MQQKSGKNSHIKLTQMELCVPDDWEAAVEDRLELQNKFKGATTTVFPELPSSP